MTAKKLLAKRSTIIKIAILAMAALLMLSVVGYVSAKYVQQIGVKGSFKVSATLAKSIEIFEHKAERQTDGSYKLGDAEVSANKYELMPGVDVPKDPTVRIKGYTGMPAYAFIRLENENFPSTVTYRVDTDKWTPLGTGYNNVWYKTLDPANGTEYPTDIEMTILEKIVDNEYELQVSQNLPRGTDVSLSFTAYLVQRTAETASGTDAQTAYDALFGTATTTTTGD